MGEYLVEGPEQHGVIVNDHYREFPHGSNLLEIANYMPSGRTKEETGTKTTGLARPRLFLIVR
jgi:hypothetical protein